MHHLRYGSCCKVTILHPIVCSPPQSPGLTLSLLVTAPSEGNLGAYWYKCFNCRWCCELLFSYSTCILATWVSAIFFFFYDLLDRSARRRKLSHWKVIFPSDVSCSFGVILRVFQKGDGVSVSF